MSEPTTANVVAKANTLYVVRWAFHEQDAFKAAFYLRQLGWMNGINAELLKDHDNGGYAVVQTIFGESADVLLKQLQTGTGMALNQKVMERGWQVRTHIWVIAAEPYIEKLLDVLDTPRGNIAMQMIAVPNLGMTLQQFDEGFKAIAEAAKPDEAAGYVETPPDPELQEEDDFRED